MQIIKFFFYFDFFLHHIRASRKNIFLDDKKINKSNFYKSKILIQIDNIDVNKYYFLKKNHMVKRAHLDTLLDIMTMLTLV